MPESAARYRRTLCRPQKSFPGTRTPRNCGSCWRVPQEKKRFAKNRECYFAVSPFNLLNTVFRVACNVNDSVSSGMLVTNGPIIQPRPAGISRVSETTSLCTYTPPPCPPKPPHLSLPPPNPPS